MRVYLDEATHTYRNEQGVIYTGCSTLVTTFKQPFDAKTAAVRYAEKHGKTPEYWLKEWDKIRDDACDDGHKFHNAKEDAVASQAVAIRFGRNYKVRNQYILQTDDISEYPDGIYTEMDLWHHGYMIAGRADKVFIETVNGMRYGDIDDYKTNKKIEMVSYKFRDGSHRMMKPPLAHLMDCNYIHYELQQSIYAFMLEANGIVPRTLRILHHGHTEDGGQQKEGKPYAMHYRKREVLAMIQYYQRYKR